MTDVGARWWCVRTATADSGIAQGRAVWRRGANQCGRQECIIRRKADTIPSEGGQSAGGMRPENRVKAAKKSWSSEPCPRWSGR